jgi:hypothetical protein
MATVSIRARDIVSYARKNNISFHRGDTGQCARGVLAKMALGKNFNATFGTLYEESTNKAIGLTAHQLASLEIGFEGDVPPVLWDSGYLKKKVDKRYHKVGQNVARLAGLA